MSDNACVSTVSSVCEQLVASGANLNDRSDESTIRHCDSNCNIDVLIVCDSFAISSACCSIHNHFV